MLKPKPFKDAEVNPEPPKRDLRDYIELFFCFLWFHHKKFAGLVLLAGLGYWIFYINTRPGVKPSDETVQRTTQRDDVPRANLDFGDVKTPADSGAQTEANDRSDSEPEGGDSAIVVSGAVDTDKKTAEAVKSSSPPRESSTSLNRLLEKGTVDELIEKTLELNEGWGQASPAVGLVMCSERAKLSRRILELDSDGSSLTDSQRQYALVAYVESVSLVDSLNVAGKMKLQGTRAALEEIKNRYCDHVDNTVRAKANLAIAIAPVYDFLESGSKEDLQRYQAELAKRFDQICKEKSTLIRMAELALSVLKKSTPELDTLPVTLDFLRRIEALNDPETEGIARSFKEQVVFVKFDPQTLALRAENEDDETRDQVQGFFQTLSENPNSSRGPYDVAIDTIATYHRLGRSDDVEALTNWLGTIVDAIEHEENRVAAKEMLKKMREHYEIGQ